MAPLQNHCLALLGVMLTLNPHNHARAWSFVPSRSVRLHDPCARSTAVRAISGVPPARRGIRMMSRDGQFVRVSLPKPLGIQLEEVQPGSPGVRVVGLVEGGTAKENGVSWYLFARLLSLANNSCLNTNTTVHYLY